MKKISKIEKKLENHEHFDVDPNIGLNDEQVKQRLSEGLVNHVAKHVSKTYWKIFFDNVVNFFNILLIAIAVFMIIAGIQFTSFAFLIVLFVNIIIGLYQDIKARRLTDKLKVVSYPYVRVIRNGEEITITANEIVLSDIVLLKSGDQIVSDGTVMDGSIEVNESILTGESANVVKNIGQTILSGTYVTSGNARYRVDHVGKANYAEKLQTSARYFKKPKSEILRVLNLMFKIIGIFVIACATSMIVTYILTGQLNPSDSNSFAKKVGEIAAALVSMIPSGMYLLTSLTLAVGAVRLGNRKVLVQELYCIEMLARANILCLDKTGTITDGTMSVNELVPLKGEKEELGNILNTLVAATGDTNVTANAIKDAFKGNTTLEYFSALPFNSERKLSAVMLKDGRSIVVGAREYIPHKNKDVDEKCEQYEKQGLRVLVIGVYKQVVTPETKLENCDIIGILVLEDHIKEDAIETIKWFKENDVKIVVISGDSPISVSSIATKAGVANADKYISLEGMSIGEVKLVANSHTVFGRVSPEQKRAIIEALKESGNTVAMTGDGVNDILALKVADCSIAMGSGADAAKNVAHLVSIDSKFSSLPDVVAEGRRVINNLQRTCSLFLVKTLFAATFSIISIITMIATGGEFRYPFETNNMYIWELITIGMGSLFLSLQPNNERLKSSFLKNLLKYSVPGALMQVIAAFSIIALAWFSHGSIINMDTAITMAVVVFTIGGYIILIRICMPFDIYRVVLLLSTAAIGIILLVIDMFTIYPNLPGGSGFFKIDYGLIGSNNWWIIPSVIAAAIPIYIGLEFATKNGFKFILKKERKQK